ncbi:MAG TPA: homocysteine S-methyltransferase family protein [Verrucomicrobiota bacterium]|nr:homocysteine S-methyltransferase family protein [Verrucomicrobiota bacterium]HNU49960.1 homocysteine S-methyltransferase family protein [Verrucomicrobiota bacterium]
MHAPVLTGIDARARHLMPIALEQLVANGPVITDGAWGTELQARGLDPGDIPDLWNLARPEAVAEVAQAYIDAGSQIILTNTFGANRIRLGDHVPASQVPEINRRGVQLSRQAAAGRALVFASIGPTGKLLLTNEVTPETLATAFTEQAQALAEGGADALVIETMADLTEATIALEAAKTTGLPVVACMVFDTGKDKDRTLMGITPEQAARALTEAGADAIGANCGVGIERYVPVCRRLRNATQRPVWIKPNAGCPTVVEGRITYNTSPAEFAAHVPDLRAAGASFIGGCCGTNPRFIQAIAQSLHPTAFEDSTLARRGREGGQAQQGLHEPEDSTGSEAAPR